MAIAGIAVEFDMRLGWLGEMDLGTLLKASRKRVSGAVAQMGGFASKPRLFRSGLGIWPLIDYMAVGSMSRAGLRFCASNQHRAVNELKY